MIFAVFYSNDYRIQYLSKVSSFVEYVPNVEKGHLKTNGFTLVLFRTDVKTSLFNSVYSVHVLYGIF